MAYRVEAVFLVEISIPTSRVTRYEEGRNTEQMSLELNLLEVKHMDAQLRLITYQAKTARYYNRKVKHKRFRIGDRFLRGITLNTKPKNFGTLGLN